MSTPNEQVPPPQYGQYAPPPAYTSYANPSYAVPPVLKAPPGTKPYTLWIWLIVAIPAVQLLISIPSLLSVNSVMTEYVHYVMSAMPADGGPLTQSEQDALAQQAAAEMFRLMQPVLGPLLLLSGAGLLLDALVVVFAGLDYRELERRGVPRPFHWGWSFFVITGAGTLVTVIGRSVVVQRRTGSGLWPIWITAVVYLLGFILGFVLAGIMMSNVFSMLGSYVTSIAA